MANPFCHVELSTNNVAEAKKFYDRLFEWRMEEMKVPGTPTGMYTTIHVGEGVGGGMCQNPDRTSAAWMPYVLVDSVDSVLEKAEKLGAKICVKKTNVLDMGAFGIFTDPFGAMLGVWETAKK